MSSPIRKMVSSRSISSRRASRSASRMRISAIGRLLVEVVVQRVDVWLRTPLSKFHRIVDDLLHPLDKLLVAGFVELPGLHHVCLEALDGVALAVLLDLV